MANRNAGATRRGVLLAAMAVLAVTGCAQKEQLESANQDRLRFEKGNGDAGQFILDRALAFGGTPKTAKGLPEVTGPWRYAEDKYGVVVRLPLGKYRAVEKLLRLAFGKPDLGPSSTTDGGRHGVYRLTPKGGAISFSHDQERTEVIVLRQPGNVEGNGSSIHP